MTIENLLDRLAKTPETVQFSDVIATIDAHYSFTPTAFKNGGTQNDAGQNNGSCKIFAFAKMNSLDTQSTLACFGDYYRADVLGNPDGTAHANIRNFITNGWAGVEFEGKALEIR